MAIAFLKVSIHTRAKGHSAVFGAAYRCGEKLKDNRLGQSVDYQNRHDVKHAEILLPEGADRQFLNREFLWNTVETSECSFSSVR